MICVSIQDKTLSEIYDILDREDVEMAEIRLDLCDLSEDEREELFSTTDKPLIATCRIGKSHNAADAEEILLQAIEDGATYVDLELEAPVQMSKHITHAAREGGIQLIRSYHDFRSTPSADVLSDMTRKCRRYGGDIIKIATMAHDAADTERVLSLYGHFPEGSLIAFCMGEAGSESRLDALRLGAPFTYAALNEQECTAPGQMSLDRINDIVYGNRRRLRRGELQMPASKSFAQRAIMTAALAEGRSLLHGYSPCGDTDAAIALAQALGAQVVKDGDTLEIIGIGPIEEPLDLSSVNVGESGLLARLSIPVLAEINGALVRIDGCGTLLNRPLAGAADIMASFGVMLSNAAPQTGKDIRIPANVNGRLMPGRADISGKGGSQIISGLLTALPLAEEDSTVYVHDPRSIPYMFITLDVLKNFGVTVGAEMEGDDDFMETQDLSRCTAVNFHIKGGQRYHAAELTIEQDWSSAAVFLVAGAIFGEVSLQGLDTKSLQADISILDILANAGACVSEDEDGTLNTYKAPLNAFDADLNNAPDLFPIVAVLAAFCPGESHIAGMGRLAGKESNRSQGILDMLGQMGVEATRDGDTLIVKGHSLSMRLLRGELLHGGQYASSHDHRMAMALKVASLGADSPIVIDDEGCVAKSFPGFYETFAA